MKRREFFQKSGATLAVGSLAAVPLFLTRSAADTRSVASATQELPAITLAKLTPVDARVDRITEVYSCVRPFRRAGPRIEAEQLNHKVIVHNYGHGGSGWSLSWGSSKLALDLVRTASQKVHKLGVIGCGPLGLTSALLAQRLGLPVCIYAKDIPPDISSMGATGHWSPSSRFCTAEHASDWTTRWMKMADFSYRAYQNLLGLPGNPVEWYHGFELSDKRFDAEPAHTSKEEPSYGEFQNHVHRYLPRQVDLSSEKHPFASPYVRLWQNMMFNISAYARMLVSDFRDAGGRIEIREFTHPSELLDLPEDTLINATGYGAKALFQDDRIIPVRGQTARLVQQPGINYAIRTEDFLLLPRRDGLVIQAMDRSGSFNNHDAAPDRGESEEAVMRLAKVMSNLRAS